MNEIKTDDFFDFEDDAPEVTLEPRSTQKVAEPSKEHESKKEELLPEDPNTKEIDFEYTNQVPILPKGLYPSEFRDIVERIGVQYSMLPRIKYSEIYPELSELTIKSRPTPSLQVINEELEKSQGAKERVTEIAIQVTECYLFKKRAVDILKESWNKFCDEKTVDKRKSDAAYRLYSFDIDLAKTEALNRACDYVMRNLDSLQNALSRRITNIQLQIKLHDIGRNALPDFEFSKKYDSFDLGTIDNSGQTDNGEELKGEEQDF